MRIPPSGPAERRRGHTGARGDITYRHAARAQLPRAASGNGRPPEAMWAAAWSGPAGHEPQLVGHRGTERPQERAENTSLAPKWKEQTRHSWAAGVVTGTWGPAGRAARESGCGRPHGHLRLTGHGAGSCRRSRAGSSPSGPRTGPRETGARGGRGRRPDGPGGPASPRGGPSHPRAQPGRGRGGAGWARGPSGARCLRASVLPCTSRFPGALLPAGLGRPVPGRT